MQPKRYGVQLTTSMQDITDPCPANRYQRVELMQVANVDTDGNTDVKVTSQWVNGDTGQVTRFGMNTSILLRDGVSMVIGVMYLLPGDYIQSAASADSDAEMTVCVFEEFLG